MPPSPALSVVRLSDAYVVVNKPSGLLSVPGKGPDKTDCVAARVRATFPNTSGPLIVHRLDMDTSGLLVLGLSPEAQRHLSAQFEARTVDKSYVALVEGLVDRPCGTIDLPMRPDVRNRPWQMIDYIHGRKAVTHFRVQAHEVDRTRLELSPITGRAHQLRLHTAIMAQQGGLGHPIIGDVLYHPRAQEIYELRTPRLMLHAAMLAFNDPFTGERVVVTSPPEF